MTTPTALAAGVHPDDIPALLDRIAQLLDQLAERDRRIRALAVTRWQGKSNVTQMRATQK